MPKATCCRICINAIKDSANCLANGMGKCPNSIKTMDDLVLTYRYPCNGYCQMPTCKFFQKINTKTFKGILDSD